MDYDPIKDTLGGFFNRSVVSRKIFYRLLDLILLRSWHIKREIRKWKRRAPFNAHILDAGCGFGQYAWYLAKQNRKWNIRAIDIKRDYVACGNDFFRQQNLQNVFCSVEDLTTYRFEKAFDLIISVDVLEHIENDQAVFENFYFNLKQGGVLLISTPSDKGGSDVVKPGQTSFVGEHVRDGYGMHEIKEKLKAAGFCKVKAHYSYGLSGKIAWKMAMKWPMEMLSVTRSAFIVLPVYYLLFIVPILVLHYIDTYTPHRSGTGLIVRAEKNALKDCVNA